MKRALTFLCLLGCYTAISDSSPRAAQTFSGWAAPRNVVELNTPSNDSYPFLSRDGLTIYFTSNRLGGQGGDDLWFATRDSVDSPLGWGHLQNMGERINSPSNDSLPFLGPNEHVMYFHSDRPGGCGEGDIWMTRRRNKNSAWERPTNLGCTLNTDKTEIAPAYVVDPETEHAWLFYGSNRPVGQPTCDRGSGDYDVYRSPVGEDGSVGPGTLVCEFSSPGRDTRIFIRKDGLEAFITSNRSGSRGIDIWVSTRDTLSDPWSVPTNLGDPFNSPGEDGSPWLSRDGTTLYFFSTRDGGSGGRDIWCMTREKLNGEVADPQSRCR
jgi:hypothetical protein